MDFEEDIVLLKDSFEGAINFAVNQMQTYVPGVRLLTKPVLTNSRLTVTVQVKGNGDYLPPYSGNLDIINSAAIRALQSLYAHKLKNTGNS